MTRSMRNVLVCIGVLLALGLLFLRMQGALRASGGALGIFSQLLGYQGTRHYAVLLIDRTKEPLLFVFSVERGSFTFSAAEPAGTLLRGLPKADYPSLSRTLITRIASSTNTPSVDALAFITSEGVSEIAGAYGGISLSGKEFDEHTIETLRERARTGEAQTELNTSLSFSVKDLVLHSSSILMSAKNIFSKHEAAVYFRRNAPGKECIGACYTELLEYLSTNASVK